MTDKKSLSSEELRKQGFESEDISNKMNIGIFGAILGIVAFLVASALGVWLIIGLATTDHFTNDTGSKEQKAALLEDAQWTALMAQKRNAAQYSKTPNGLEVKEGSVPTIKELKNCHAGSGKLCDTVQYRNQQKILLLRGGKDPYSKEETLPIQEGMKRLLENRAYLSGI